MSSIMHPLKGEFDTAAAKWTVISGTDGAPGLEVGFADNGMVALREPGARNANLLIYTPSEWEAFVAGVKDGEFDPETF
jgi:hypothetical protein